MTVTPRTGPAAWPPRTDVLMRGAVRRVVGIGELIVSGDDTETIVTYALGSCIAVCIWDPVAGVGGLLHFLLPDSATNPERARVQPATFADSGLPLLFQSAYALGLEKKRCRVRLIGGADVAGVPGAGSLNVGKRNIQAARNILSKNGLLVECEVTGGSMPRSVALRLRDGAIDVSSGRDILHQI